MQTEGAFSGGADEDEIPEPITPGRTERGGSACSGGCGQRASVVAAGSSGSSGSSGSLSAVASYHSLYEEANQLLKNLHFERLLRHVPASPDRVDSRPEVSPLNS